MNPHALSVLEFERALERVARRAGTAMGKERILALRPVADPVAVRRELDRVSETLRILVNRPDFAVPVASDARPALRTLGADGATLSGEGLLLTLRLLAASRELSSELHDSGVGEREPDGDAEAEASPAFPHLGALRSGLLERAELESWLTGIVDDEGAIRDGASSTLAAVRRRLRTARGTVLRKLERFLVSLPERIRVEGASVSVRDGHFVIPIRREGRSEVGGIVHGESATGGTLFVEPPMAIELMNEVHELEREEAREIARILRAATERLRPLHLEMERAFEGLVDFDGLWARALSARAWDAHPPRILDPDDQRLTIVEGRHPLLLELGERVVPFFLELGPDERVVVVSGPNTGGKTVLLKAMGLISALAQSGIVPPVGEGTCLPVLEDVLADIGDEQSIAESLSTFSAHLMNARQILEGAGPHTLVLMDELGTGTDPSEGAALARAILEVLVERGARALVSSHLGALKRLDGEGSGIVNASLLFDSEEIAPTYQLQKGRPGRSYGLAIARRLGLPAEVMDRAERYVDAGELRLETLLETLEARERELSEALREAEEASLDASDLRREAEAREARLEERERSAESRAREHARRLLLEARREVESAIEEVRESRVEEGAAAAARARRRVEEAARRHGQAPLPSSRHRSGHERVAVAEGDPVTVVGSGARGVVLELRDDRVTVEVGSVRLRLPRDEVELVGAATERADRRIASRPRGAVVGFAPEMEVRTEADLRGLRVEEVDLSLGRALDGAVVANLSELRIIHGKGTGAVRSRVQELLRADARVMEFRSGGPGEGGWGVTIAVLRS